MNMSQLEEQGGEEASAGVVEFESGSLEFLRRKMFLHHYQTNLPCLPSLGHTSISRGTIPGTRPSFVLVEAHFEGLAKSLLPYLDREEVGEEVESKSQIPLPPHSMEKQFSPYKNLPWLYSFEPETPPSSPFLPKLFDQGTENYAACLNLLDDYISPSSYIEELLDREGEVHPLYKGVRKSLWGLGGWEAEVRGRNGRSTISLGTFDTPEDAARAHDQAAFIIWGRRARLNFREFHPRGHSIPAIPVSGYSAYPEEISGDDHLTIRIHQLEEEETMPTPTYAVQGLCAKAKTTLGKRAMNRINRSIQGIPNELLVGLIGATYQYMSMPLPIGNSRYILTVANVLGFLFLLIGMVRRARKCSCANLLLFMGTLLSSGGIVFSMSRDIHGLLGWFVPAACLLVVMTAIVF